jgi:nucleoside-diphosphate-sugar epimerase
MTRILVLGAGNIGQNAAARLAARGHDVRLASRSGSARVEGVETLRLDASDADATRRAAASADTVVNAMNPPSYTTWDRDWPPVARSVQAAVEATGGRLVMVGNLYAYGRVDAPMTEDTPLRPAGHKGELRKQMWLDLEQATREGRLRATELRASDYVGPAAGSGISHLNDYVVPPASRGRTVRLVVGDPDATHTWTVLDDIAELVARLAVCEDDDVWGRPWMVPSPAPMSFREVAAQVAALSGHPAPKVVRYPAPVRAALRLVPMVRELEETRHQFESPFVVDSTAAQERFGLEPTPMDVALKATLESRSAAR